MGDYWNPFDPKNPVYKELEKSTRLQSRRIRNTVVVTGVLVTGFLVSRHLAGKALLTDPRGWFGGPVNQFGMVHRK